MSVVMLNVNTKNTQFNDTKCQNGFLRKGMMLKRDTYLTYEHMIKINNRKYFL